MSVFCCQVVSTEQCEHTSPIKPFVFVLGCTRIVFVLALSHLFPVFRFPPSLWLLEKTDSAVVPFSCFLGQRATGLMRFQRRAEHAEGTANDVDAERLPCQRGLWWWQKTQERTSRPFQLLKEELMQATGCRQHSSGTQSEPHCSRSASHPEDTRISEKLLRWPFLNLLQHHVPALNIDHIHSTRLGNDCCWLLLGEGCSTLEKKLWRTLN